VLSIGQSNPLTRLDVFYFAITPHFTFSPQNAIRPLFLAPKRHLDASLTHSMSRTLFLLRPLLFRFFFLLINDSSPFPFVLVCQGSSAQEPRPPQFFVVHDASAQRALLSAFSPKPKFPPRFIDCYVPRLPPAGSQSNGHTNSPFSIPCE